MYAMLGTRPDIAYAVSLINRYSANPTSAHWNAVIRIFRYLRGTVHYELVYKGSLKDLSGYIDSDWAGDSTRRFTSDYLFNLGSGAISWSSKRQTTMALFICETEYIGQTQAIKEVIWLKNLLNQLLRPDDSDPKATVIFGDNQGAIALAKNAQFHARTKHIDIAHHFVREKVNDGIVDVQYVPIDKQMADGLTKALCLDKFVAFRDALGVEAAPHHPLKATWTAVSGETPETPKPPEPFPLFSALSSRGAISLVPTLRMIDRVIDRDRNYPQNLNISLGVPKLRHTTTISGADLSLLQL